MVLQHMFPVLSIRAEFKWQYWSVCLEMSSMHLATLFQIDADPYVITSSAGPLLLLRTPYVLHTTRWDRIVCQKNLYLKGFELLFTTNLCCRYNPWIIENERGTDVLIDNRDQNGTMNMGIYKTLDTETCGTMVWHGYQWPGVELAIEDRLKQNMFIATLADL